MRQCCSQPTYRRRNNNCRKNPAHFLSLKVVDDYIYFQRLSRLELYVIYCRNLFLELKIFTGLYECYNL